MSKASSIAISHCAPDNGFSMSSHLTPPRGRNGTTALRRPLLQWRHMSVTALLITGDSIVTSTDCSWTQKISTLRITSHVCVCVCANDAESVIIMVWRKFKQPVCHVLSLRSNHVVTSGTVISVYSLVKCMAYVLSLKLQCCGQYLVDRAIIRPGPLFSKRTDVLPLDLVESWSHEIGCYDLKFDRHLDSTAVGVPVKCQSDWDKPEFRGLVIMRDIVLRRPSA